MIIIAEVSELSRKIKLPTDRVLSVNGDYQVDGIAFKLPATYDGNFDFSTAAARVHWTGVDKVEHTNLITEVDGNGYPLWTMPSELTQGGHGVIEFAVSFVATDETAAVTKRWISDPVSFRNRRTVNGSNEDEEAEEETTYDRLASAIATVRAAQAEVEDTNAVLSSLTGSAPVPVENRSDMVDDGHLYLYTGDETGLVTGNLYYYVNGTLTNGGQYGSMEVDATLTQSGQAADAKKTGDEISAIKEDLSTKTGLSEEAKQALLACFAKVAWIDENGQDYYDALEDALYPPANLVSISAVYTQSETVYDTNSLDRLKSDLVVTAHYSDSTSSVATGYALSGTLAKGTSIITVTYGGKTTTFTVDVTSGTIPSEYQMVEYIEGDGTQHIVTNLRNDTDYGDLVYKIKYYKATQARLTGDLIYGSLSMTKNDTAPVEVGFNGTTNRLFAFSKSSAEIIDPIVYGSVNELTVKYSDESPYITMSLTDGNTTLTSEKLTTNNDYNQKYIFIFGIPSYRAAARIYSLTAFNGNSVFAHFIPCYRKSDGVIGMYETVTQQFFTNSETGTFLKGADV